MLLMCLTNEQFFKNLLEHKSVCSSKEFPANTALNVQAKNARYRIAKFFYERPSYLFQAGYALKFVE